MPYWVGLGPMSANQEAYVTSIVSASASASVTYIQHLPLFSNDSKTRRDGSFIYNMAIPFTWYRNFDLLEVCPTFENQTLVITFEPEEIRLSYFTCILL